MDPGSGRDLSPSFEKPDPSLPSVTRDDRRGVSFQDDIFGKAIQYRCLLLSSISLLTINLQPVFPASSIGLPSSIQYRFSSFIQHRPSIQHPAPAFKKFLSAKTGFCLEKTD
jgi:hypothetical protein